MYMYMYIYICICICICIYIYIYVYIYKYICMDRPNGPASIQGLASLCPVNSGLCELSAAEVAFSLYLSAAHGDAQNVQNIMYACTSS